MNSDATIYNLTAALSEFKTATAKLAAVWIAGDFDGDEIADLPDYLPSFDEFAAEIADAHMKDNVSAS